MVLKRATMAAVTAIVTVNVWTGCPLLALWVGSRAVGRHDLSMGAVVVVLIVLALLEGAMLLLLGVAVERLRRADRAAAQRT